MSANREPPRDLMRALEDGRHPRAAAAATIIAACSKHCRGNSRTPCEAPGASPSKTRAVATAPFTFPASSRASSSSRCSPIAARGPSGARPITTPTRRRVMSMSPSICGCAIDARIDALIHLGTHGTLEWLPGKSAMLGEDCAPEAVLGPTPLIYPFIVNDPGEAAQAKRRACAVTIGHLTPPLEQAQLYDDAARIEQMLDEYANAAALDPRRAKLIAGAIMDEAERSGLGAECGVTRGADAADALAKLDAWLCDMKEMRIGDGLHVFRPRARRRRHARRLRQGGDVGACCARSSGRFIEPGPAGAPSRGRVDVLPTGRNLFCIDPRHVPTRTAYDIGRRAAARGDDAPRAGAWRLAARDHARSVGQRDDPHRRRGFRASARAAGRHPAVGQRHRAGDRFRDRADGRARFSARRCDAAHLGIVPRHVSGSDRAVSRRRERRRGAGRRARTSIR